MRKDISQTHKTRLRAQLLAHAEEHLTKKKPNLFRYWPAVAIPAVALSIFAVTSLWQPLEKSSNPIVQQVAGPLTAQKVFAEAIKYIDKQQLKPGEYFYTRSIEENTYNDKDSADPGNTCLHTKEYREMYTNAQGIMERMTRSDQNGTLFQLSTQTPDGRNSGPKFFSNVNVSNALEVPVPCPDMTLGVNRDAPPVSIDEYLGSPAHQIFMKITSGIPWEQKEALTILEAENDYTIRENRAYHRVCATGYRGERRSG